MAEQFVPIQTAGGNLNVPLRYAGESPQNADKALEIGTAQNLSSSIEAFNSTLSPDKRLASVRGISSEQDHIDQQEDSREHVLESLRTGLSDNKVVEKLAEQNSLLERTLPRVGRRAARATSIVTDDFIDQHANGIDVPESLRNDIERVTRTGEKLTDSYAQTIPASKERTKPVASPLSSRTPSVDVAQLQEAPRMSVEAVRELLNDWPKPKEEEPISSSSNGIEIVDPWDDVEPIGAHLNSPRPLADIWGELELTETPQNVTTPLPEIHPADEPWSNPHTSDTNEIPQTTTPSLPDVLPADAEWFDDSSQDKLIGTNPTTTSQREVPEHLLKRSRVARQRAEQANIASVLAQSDISQPENNKDPIDSNDQAGVEQAPVTLSVGHELLNILDEVYATGKKWELGLTFDLVSEVIVKAETDENPFADLTGNEINLLINELIVPFLLHDYAKLISEKTGQKVNQIEYGKIEPLIKRILSKNKEKFPELDQTPDDDTIDGDFDDDTNEPSSTTILPAKDKLVVTLDDDDTDDTIDGDFDDVDASDATTDLTPNPNDKLIVTLDEEDNLPLDMQFSIEEDGISDEAMLNFVNSYPKENRVRLREMSKESLIEFYDMVHSEDQPTFVRLGEVAADRVVSGAKGVLRRARQAVEETRQAALDARTATQEPSNEQRSRLPKIDRQALLARIPPEARASFSTFSDELLRDAVASLERSLQDGTTLSRIPRSAAEVKGVARRTTSAVARAAVNTRQRNLERRR